MRDQEHYRRHLIGTNNKAVRLSFNAKCGATGGGGGEVDNR